jgi:hypothetical protein
MIHTNEDMIETPLHPYVICAESGYSVSHFADQDDVCWQLIGCTDCGRLKKVERIDPWPALIAEAREMRGRPDPPPWLLPTVDAYVRMT